ncbi:phosphatase PAP2 family protein [Streptomyces sp. NPDC006733]|uniref:phosphatase PAP2 family protein n=1 Tax=Streptomyces sp. NPDC006733 TaxID=3155460 RepID=UPI0033E95C36
MRTAEARQPTSSTRSSVVWITGVAGGAGFALLAILVGARHGALLPGDHATHVWALTHRPRGALTAARWITATGTGVWPYAMALAAGILAVRDRRQRLYAAGGALAFLALGQVLRTGLMQVIGRARPPTGDWATHASRFAFPSGHTTTSAMAAGLLAWAVLRRCRPAAARVAVALLACWAVLVGCTRIYLGVHWLTDVLAGWLLAAAWISLGTAVSAVYLPRRPADGTSPGGGS